jgi:hypothetical protein
MPLLMTEPDARANDLLRALIREARYPWAWRKLNSARMYLLESLPRIPDEEWTSQRVVTNGDAAIV